MEKRQRKHPRLDCYDYSTAGAYFITICTHDRKQLFSNITKTDENPPQIQLTALGTIAQEQLYLLEERYPYVHIGCSVIMPDHIHILLYLSQEDMENTPRYDLIRIIGAYKSLTTKQIQTAYRYFDRVFQTSFFEHVVRNRQDYNEIQKYILENPVRWYFKYN